ncbi:hypothetical protein L596_022865 [Steinernema carpocapsae]|uniref:Uncharacterized protein n=1 Tax=Steinernema carpocapsae TaxID=34508 RepID=A0A4U5MBR5_STECR|nr:hypothetical protein L596_022865 [Steinernema carpocapsae]
MTRLGPQANAQRTYTASKYSSKNKGSRIGNLWILVTVIQRKIPKVRVPTLSIRSWNWYSHGQVAEAPRM